MQLDSRVQQQQQQQQQQQNTDDHQNILNNILNRYKLIHFLILSSLLYWTVKLSELGVGAVFVKNRAAS